MKTFLIIIELITAILVVIAVLVHSAKGEGLGGIGGQARLFSSQKDLEKNLNKITAFLATLFIGIALFLGLFQF